MGPFYPQPISHADKAWAPIKLIVGRLRERDNTEELYYGVLVVIAEWVKRIRSCFDNLLLSS